MEDQRLPTAIYCRISNDPEGREFGVQRQEQDCRRLASNLGLEVAHVYVENDVSASTKSKKARPEYTAMLGAVRAGAFSTVLAYSNSRLTRRPKEWLDLMEVPGLKVHTVASGSVDFTTADGRAVALTIAAWDGAEAERTSERVTRAAQQRAEAGEWHGGHLPHGYRLEDGRLVIDPATAPLMQEAARRLLTGESLYAVASDFNARGLLTSKGSHWRSQTIRKAMLSPSIVGKREHGGQLYDGKWEPLIADKAWQQLRELLTDTSRKFGSMDGSYAGKRALGGGLSRCADCGQALVSQGAARLVCHSQATGGCGGVTITYEPFEEWLLSLVLARIDSPRWQRENARQTQKADTRADRLRAERRTLTAERQRVVRSYDLGVRAEDEMLRRVREIDAEVGRIDGQLSLFAADTVLDPVETSSDARRLWREADTTKRRRFLASMIEQVHVHKWPEGMPTKLTQRTSERMAARQGRQVESDEDFARRQDEHRREALRQRVCIKWRR